LYIFFIYQRYYCFSHAKSIACLFYRVCILQYTSTQAFAITVSGGKVYTAGHYRNSDDKTVACYWESAAKTDLSDGTTNAYAYGVDVSGGKVYTAGLYRNSDGKYVACYWEGATKTDLSDGTTDAYAYGIDVQ